MIGIGLGITTAQFLAFDPANMFGGRVGLLLSAARLSSLSQDAAGTTPANAPGQPVGLVRDLSGGNRHASQATSAARPTLGRHPRSGRRNLLLQSNTIASPNWGKSRVTVGDYSAVGPDGLVSLIKMVENTENAAHFIDQSFSFLAGTQYTFTCYARAAERSVLQLVLPSGAFGTTIAAFFDLTGDGASIVRSGGQASIDHVGGGLFRCRLTATTAAASTAGVNIRMNTVFADTLAGYQGDGVSGLHVGFAQIEVGGNATDHQSVTTAFDVTEAGQPDVWYLSTDAIDDFLATSAFEWGSDEVTIVAALRKRSDAAEGWLAHFGNYGTTGAWAMAGPGGAAGEEFWSMSRGSAQSFAVDTNAARNAPVSAVVVMQGKISADLNVLRVNGAQVATATGDQSVAATYGLQQLFIGARNGNALPAAMDLYAFFAINRVLTPAELAQVERWAANEMGVTL